MPKLGLTMTEGTITEWVVDAGQKVEKGSVVMLIETDKVEAEVEADADGIVQYVANVGDTLEPGEVVGWLLADEEKADNENEEEPPSKETVEEQPQQNQENDTSEPELSEEQNVEESVPQQEPEKSQSSDRILASPNAKRVAKEKGIDLQQVSGSGPSGRITSEDVNAMQGSIPVTSNGRILASPNAKRVAKEKGIDLQTLTGTGPGGRITSEDVIEAPKPEVQAPPQEPQIEKGISRNHCPTLSSIRCEKNCRTARRRPHTSQSIRTRWKNNKTRCFRPQQNAWYTTTNTNTNFIAYRSRWKQNTNKGNESNHRRPHALFTTRNGATHPNHGCKYGPSSRTARTTKRYRVRRTWSSTWLHRFRYSCRSTSPHPTPCSK